MSDMTRRRAMALAAATGVVTVLSTQTEADDDMPSDMWRAWAITEGDETRLTVEGIYSNGGPGKVVIVKPSAPQGINPKILMLDVKTATLPGIWATVLHPIPTSFTRAPYKAGQYTSIHLRYPDGTAVMIDKIVDAGQGPK